MKKKLSFFLAIVMIISLLPMTVSAASNTVYNAHAVRKDDTLTDLNNAPVLVLDAVNGVWTANEVLIELDAAEWAIPSSIESSTVNNAQGYKYVAVNENSYVGYDATGTSPDNYFVLTKRSDTMASIEFGYTADLSVTAATINSTKAVKAEVDKLVAGLNGLSAAANAVSAAVSAGVTVVIGADVVNHYNNVTAASDDLQTQAAGTTDDVSNAASGVTGVVSTAIASVTAAAIHVATDSVSVAADSISNAISTIDSALDSVAAASIISAVDAYLATDEVVDLFNLANPPTISAGNKIPVPLFVKITKDEGTANVKVLNSYGQFDAGEYAIAYMTKNTISIKANSTPDETGRFVPTGFTFQEIIGSVFKDGAATDIVLTAPRGYTWIVDGTRSVDLVSGGALRGLVGSVSGSAITKSTTHDNKLTITIPAHTRVPNSSAYLKIDNFTGIRLSPAENVNTGDVNLQVKVGGADEQTIKIATIVDFGASLKLTDDKVTELVAGDWDLDGDNGEDGIVLEKTFYLADNSPYQWSTGRTTRFFISDNAKIVGAEVAYDNLNGDNDGNFKFGSDNYIPAIVLDNATTKKTVSGEGTTTVSDATVTVSENQITVYSFTGAANEKSKISVKLFVRVKPGAEDGDDVVITTDSAAVSESSRDLTIGKVVSPITVEVEGTSIAKIAKNLDGGKITITENFAGAIKAGTVYTRTEQDTIINTSVVNTTANNNARVTLAIDRDVFGEAEFTAGTVEVVSGDAEILKSGIDNGQIYFELKYESEKEASVFEVTGVKFAVDRFFYAGDYDLSVSGNAVARNGMGGFGSEDPYFTIEDDTPLDTVGKTPGATGVNHAVSYFGTMNINNGGTFTDAEGNVTEFDPPIIIKNGRTLVALRSVLNLLGIGEEGIDWNAGTRTATLTGPHNTVTFVAGVNYYEVDSGVGGIFEIDVPAEIINNRMYVPLKAAFEGFGGVVGDYNAVTKTADFSI